MFYESVDLRDVDIVGAVGPDLVLVDLGEDVGCVFSDAALVPKLGAEAAEAVIVGWGDDYEQVVDVMGLARFLVEGFHGGGEEHGLEVDVTLVVGGSGDIAEVEHDGDWEGVLPSGLEPTGVVVRPQEVELHAAQFVAASSEGVQEKVRMGVDGNRHSVAGGDGRDRFVGGDQIFSVVLSPVHKRVGGQGAGLSDDRCSRVKGQTLL